MSQAEGSAKAKVVRGERCVVLQHLLKTLMQAGQARWRTREDGVGRGCQGSAGPPGSEEEGRLDPEGTGEPWVDSEQRRYRT